MRLRRNGRRQEAPPPLVGTLKGRVQSRFDQRGRHSPARAFLKNYTTPTPKVPKCGRNAANRPDRRVNTREKIQATAPGRNIRPGLRRLDAQVPCGATASTAPRLGGPWGGLDGGDGGEVGQTVRQRGDGPGGSR